MTRRLVIRGAALMALVTMTACGGADPSAESSDASSTPAATPAGDAGPENTTRPSEASNSQDGGGSGGGGGNRNSGGAGDDGFAYTPWGPGDPPIPGQYAAFAGSPNERPQCGHPDDFNVEGAFWEIALAVCRAIVEGAAWPETTSVPEPPAAPNGYEKCLDAELKAMLERALSWHAENPGLQPEVDYPSDTSTSPCQARIYDAVVLEPEASLTGKVPVVITATALDKNPSVRVDGKSVEFTNDFHVDEPDNAQLATVVVLVQTAEQPRTAKIEITTDRGPMEYSVDLPGSGPSPSPTDVTTQTQTDPPVTDPPATESRPAQAPDE